jgi:hypothetical protein
MLRGGGRRRHREATPEEEVPLVEEEEDAVLRPPEPRPRPIRAGSALLPARLAPRPHHCRVG